jgi:hypothetical protein
MEKTTDRTKTPKDSKKARTRKAPPTLVAQLKKKLKTFERDARREFERTVDTVLDRLGLVRKSKLEAA